MSLFAKQISDTLGSVLSVAVHDREGGLVWAGMGEYAADFWSVESFQREIVPGCGFCERLSNRNFAYFFYLRNTGDAVVATLGIQIDASNPVSLGLEHAHREICPILECIERQIGINCELSAVRRLSIESQRGMELLQSLDAVDGYQGLKPTLCDVLERVSAHYGSTLSAILLPRFDLMEIRPASLLSDEAAAANVRKLLKSLLGHVRRTRQILLSEVSLTTPHRAGIGRGKPKILCSPVFNSKDAVVGAMVLLQNGRFTTSQIGLSRAICARVNSLARVSSRLAEHHFSRHGFINHVASVLRLAPNERHALLYLDIDTLHVVNDGFGHLAGDQVIRAVSGIIDDVCGARDAVTHLNGDNFALFIRCCGTRQAVERAELILQRIRDAKIVYEGEPIDVTASIGLALIPKVVKDAASALNTGELAVHSAKGRGGDRVVVFGDLDASVVQRRSDLDQLQGIQLAIIENRFELHAQPIAPLIETDGRPHFEILIRMLSADGELLHPGRFLQAAERYRMMPALDRWVIRNTLMALSDSDNILDISMSSFGINISPQSLADDDFLEFVEARIAESGISPDALCFEITETAIVKNLERAQQCIRRLRKLGCRLALDDFGTGYCSFAYLKDLPVQYLKIDGAFIRDLLDNPLSESIVTSIAAIARVMHARTVAEHVESELVQQRLRQLNIDYAQGFAIGRPAPLDGVLAGLRIAAVDESQSLIRLDAS